MGSIFSTKKGSGNSVILIHGFCETHEIWKDFSDLLSSNYTIYTPDLPGFGKSPIPQASFTINDIAQLVQQWIDINKIEKPVIIGHSLGGYVALALAAKKPEGFSGLGLFHSTAEADTPEKKENRNKVIDFVTKNGVQPYIDSFVPALFYQKKHSAVEFVHKIASSTKKESIIKYAVAMRDRVDSIDFLKTFQQPTLFMAGQFDTFVTPQNMRLQSKSLPKSYFYELENTGHMGMFENDTEAAKVVKNFLTGCF